MVVEEGKEKSLFVLEITNFPPLSLNMHHLWEKNYRTGTRTMRCLQWKIKAAEIEHMQLF